MIKHIYYLGDKISDNLFQLKNSDELVEQIRKLFGDKHFPHTPDNLFLSGHY